MPVTTRVALVSLALLLSACSSHAPAPQPVYIPPSASSAYQGGTEDVLFRALGLVGTPYRYGGNTPEGGFDCSGLIGYVYQSRAGIAPPRTVAQLRDFGQPVDGDGLRTGDLVVFGAGRPTHAGIYVGEGRFVHAPSSGGTVRLDSLDNVYWQRVYLDAKRVITPELAHNP